MLHALPGTFLLVLLLRGSPGVLRGEMPADWTQRRGPLQNGPARKRGCQDSFEPAKEGRNVAWIRAPHSAVRFLAAPFMDARVYVFGIRGGGLARRETRRVGLDENEAGKKVVGVHTTPSIHSDIVSSRIGWTGTLDKPTRPPVTVHAHTQPGGRNSICLDNDGQTSLFFSWDATV